jgi:hypothetical protein
MLCNIIGILKNHNQETVSGGKLKKREKEWLMFVCAYTHLDNIGMVSVYMRFIWMRLRNRGTVSGGKFMNTTQRKKTSYTPHKKQN